MFSSCSSDFILKIKTYICKDKMKMLIQITDHEHARVDRDHFVEVNWRHTDTPELFVKSGNDSIETQFPYEIRSIMHHCSECGSNGMGPVMHQGSANVSMSFF